LIFHKRISKEEKSLNFSLVFRLAKRDDVGCGGKKWMKVFHLSLPEAILGFLWTERQPLEPQAVRRKGETD